jgi:hypothetical protein
VSKVYRYLALAIIAIALVFAVFGTATVAQAVGTDIVVESIATPPADPVPATTTPSASNPGVLEQFGPPGVIITTILTGVLMIVRSINEGKKIDVTTYKERAADAETRSNEEIGKVHKKLAELEVKLDEVIADRDEYRNTLEERKQQFTQQVLDMEKRHQRELEDMHAALMIEVHTRHRLERLLAEHGITVPETPPPYTKSMRDAVTPKERVEAAQSATEMKNLRESESEA